MHIIPGVDTGSRSLLSFKASLATLLLCEANGKWRTFTELFSVCAVGINSVSFIQYGHTAVTDIFLGISSIYKARLNLYKKALEAAYTPKN